MLEVLGYFIMQSLGFRMIHHDIAFARGIPLVQYSGWIFRPWFEQGTYREQLWGKYEYAGYGVDK